MSTDIRHDIDRSFGEGPAHPPLAHQVAAGERALRRRRGTAALATCAAVAVLGASYAVATSGSSTEGRTPIATDPTTAATSATSPVHNGVPSPTEPPWEGDDPVRYVHGELQVRPGVVVHERLLNPFGYTRPDASDALDLTFEGQRMWVLTEQVGRGSTYTSSTPSAGWASFHDWVTDQVTSARGGSSGSGQPATLRLAADGSVVPAGQNTIAQRTDDPQLGPDFAPPGTPTGAAVVQIDGGPLSVFVVWRVVDGQLDVITAPPRDTVGATFDELLTYARAQYASGVGLR